MKIYLAGDSIVQNYEKEEFIAGWGQFLPFFIKDGVEVVNDAKGFLLTRADLIILKKISVRVIIC